MSAFRTISSILGAIQTLIAVALAGVSIWFFIELKGFTDLRNKDKYLLDFTVSWPQITPWMFLFIGFLVICVNACGLHSACTKKRSTIFVYLGFLAIATLLAFAAGIVGLTCAISESSDSFVSKTVSDAFDQIKVRSEVAQAFGDIERRLRCCGIKGSRDYTQSSIPSSCCDKTEATSCDISAQSRRGCADVAVPYAQLFIKFSSIGSIIISLLGVGCVLSTVLMALYTQRKRATLKSQAEKEPLKLPL